MIFYKKLAFVKLKSGQNKQEFVGEMGKIKDGGIYIKSNALLPVFFPMADINKVVFKK